MFHVPVQLGIQAVARHQEVVAAVRHPDLAKRFSDLAAEPIGSSPREQEAMLRKQMEQFRPVRLTSLS